VYFNQGRLNPEQNEALLAAAALLIDRCLGDIRRLSAALGVGGLRFREWFSHFRDAVPQAAKSEKFGLKPEVVVFRRVAGCDLEAHVYSPPDGRGAHRPAIPVFHGGGFYTGEPGGFQPYCKYFAGRGMLARSVVRPEGLGSCVCARTALWALDRVSAKRGGPGRTLAHDVQERHP
jgi:hypothetical protein